MRGYNKQIVILIVVIFFLYIYISSSNVSQSYEKHPKKRRIVNRQFEETLETPNGNKTYSELEDAVFRPMGYTLRENLIVPGLDYTEKLNCPKVFSDWLNRSLSQDESATPPRKIPDELFDQYTLEGHVYLITAYMDNRSGTKNAAWSKAEIEQYMNKDIQQVTNYDGEGRAVYHAMKAYGVKGKKGVVVGSLTPWVEAFALKLGAEHVTTVEYMKINIEHDRLDYKHPIDIAKEAEKHIGAYDFVTSFSSLEHSGLGRFGDALDPMGDLREAMKINCMLKENGLFFVAFPFGWDTVHWNLHRIYGRIRFALFAAGFDIVGMYYKDEKRQINAEMFAKPKTMGEHQQPVMVLRKR